ncbi:MAG: hypothetical protein JXB47_07390 [Anaerolineae bacterium]|nr:hypothetical protein [Anaerolineae bacterium]
MKQVIILSGAIGAGKSTVCAGVIERVRETNSTQGLKPPPIRVAGVFAPAEIVDGAKVGIWLEDLANGKRRRLAVAARIRRTGDVTTKEWTFDVAALDWGAAAIARACPCDLLVIDELGPLELERGEGWQVAFDVLRDGDYKWAIVIVRTWLAAKMQARLAAMPGVAARVVAVDESNRDALPAEIAGRLI